MMPRFQEVNCRHTVRARFRPYSPLCSIVLGMQNPALVSMDKGLDATTPTGRLMMNLLASVSQWEREIIGQRTKEAMHYLKVKR